MHHKKIITGGKKLEAASRALVMVHGRGGSAEDILSVSEYLNVRDFALVAPQATGNSWYPYSFLSEPSRNEPWLSSAIDIMGEVVQDIIAAGIEKEHIYLLGFSQGACLGLEFATRHAGRLGGVIALTGGLIGDKIYTGNYSGDFAGTPVFLGTSDPDPHVPVARVDETATLMEEMNAAVTKKVYMNMGHTISQEEISIVNKIFFPNEQTHP